MHTYAYQSTCPQEHWSLSMSECMGTLWCILKLESDIAARANPWRWSEPPLRWVLICWEFSQSPPRQAEQRGLWDGTCSKHVLKAVPWERTWSCVSTICHPSQSLPHEQHQWLQLFEATIPGLGLHSIRESEHTLKLLRKTKVEYIQQGMMVYTCDPSIQEG